MEAQQLFGDQVTFIGVAGRDSLEASQDFIADLGLEDLTHIVDGEGEVWSMFDIRSQPAWVLINDDGRGSAFLGRLGPDGIAEAVDLLAAS